MNFNDAISTLKEFFLEVLGFIIPGFIFLFLIYLFLKQELKLGIDTFIVREQATIIIVLISYVIGYVLFGISAYWRDKKKDSKPKIVFKLLRKLCLIEKTPYAVDLENDIKKSHIYKSALIVIKELTGLDIQALESQSVRQSRNIAMSYVPEADKKIYNFMFRSELSDKVSYALKVVALLGLFSYVFLLIPGWGWIFINNETMWIYYLILFIPAFFLRQIQKRFYGISIRVIFPIFVAKFRPSNSLSNE